MILQYNDIMVLRFENNLTCMKDNGFISSHGFVIVSHSIFIV